MLTNRKWCLLHTSVAPSICAGPDLHLLRAKIRFSRTLEKKSCHRSRRNCQAVYCEDIFNEILSNHDWQMKEDPTEEYKRLIKELKSYAESALTTPTRSTDRISTTTKALLENWRKLRHNSNAIHLVRLIIEFGYIKALQKDLKRYRHKKLLEAAQKDLLPVVLLIVE
ncbi:hypothetical protein KIN20_030285 [Parelaphostrongylus tenuis]|uniref:Uncharacterized protein n=1 Tax=Parelaphostrongylus tenuis TaxID=148309 RepID=A0AAD5R3H4_PARTN|nr:hypothetical protein KIN20_030285 [Parelaphostrongylus tenuis]